MLGNSLLNKLWNIITTGCIVSLILALTMLVKVYKEKITKLSLFTKETISN